MAPRRAESPPGNVEKNAGGGRRRAAAQVLSGTPEGSSRGPSQRPPRRRGPNRRPRLPPHVVAARCLNPNATRKVGERGVGTRWRTPSAGSWLRWGLAGQRKEVPQARCWLLAATFEAEGALKGSRAYWAGKPFLSIQIAPHLNLAHLSVLCPSTITLCALAASAAFPFSTGLFQRLVLCTCRSSTWHAYARIFMC